MENTRDPLELSNANFWSACSACAGDYEDPGRTARPPEEEWADDEYEPQMAGAEDFLKGEGMPQE